MTATNVHSKLVSYQGMIGVLPGILPLFFSLGTPILIRRIQRDGMSGSRASVYRSGCAGDNGLVVDVEPGQFEEMVITALDGLPEDLGRLMRNVVVTVEHGVGPQACSGCTRASR